MPLVCNCLKNKTEKTQVTGMTWGFRWGDRGWAIESGGSSVLRDGEPISKCVAVKVKYCRNPAGTYFTTMRDSIGKTDAGRQAGTYSHHPLMYT